MLTGFYKQLNEILAFENKTLLEGFLKALEKNRMYIVFYCIIHKIKRHSFISTLIYFIVLFNLDRKKFFNK